MPWVLVASADRIEAEVARLQGFMAEASRIVLADKLTIGSDAKIVRWPDRYSDPRGAVMWETVTRLVAELRSPDPIFAQGVR